jgi:tetratricopeptide (TPR) repeat protein
MKKLSAIGSVLAWLILCAATALAQQSAPPKQNDQARDLNDKAEKLMFDNKFDEAIGVINQAISLEPGRVDLYDMLGWIYFTKADRTGDDASLEKSFAALRRAIELDPAGWRPYYSLGQFLLLKRRAAEALAVCEQGLKRSPEATQLYVVKWGAMLQPPDYELEVPKVRAEIDKLVKLETDREAVLQVAISGYELLQDEEGRRTTEDLFVAEFPKSQMVEAIVFGRVMRVEDDKNRQAVMAEEFINRFPNSRRSGELYSILFRHYASHRSTPDEKILQLGEAWLNSEMFGEWGKIHVFVTVVAVLAERGYVLERALVLADEAVKMADNLTMPKSLASSSVEATREQLTFLYTAEAAFLKQRVHALRGLVLLRSGKPAEADNEFQAGLQLIIAEVEKTGSVEWKPRYQGEDLSELGVRPPVLWLAELYEVQGEYERAAKFLLAGYGGDELARRYIRERLPVVYQKLGRSGDQAQAKIVEAARRFYAAFITTGLSEEEKTALLAKSLRKPAPPFHVVGLDQKRLRLGDFKGQVLVLNFWSTTCTGCVKELPYLQRVADKYKGNPDVAFLILSLDIEPQAIPPFLKKHGYTLRAAYDQEGVEKAYEVDAMPQTFIIDRSGVIRFRDIGFKDVYGPDFVKAMSFRIDELLKQKSDISPAQSTGTADSSVNAAANPVKWSVSVGSPPKGLKAGDKLTVQVVAQIGSGWHFYSLTQPAGGPVPASISLPEEQSFRLVDPIKAQQPKSEFDNSFGVNTEWYEGAANFTLPVQVVNGAKPGKQKLLVNVRFQACNGDVCLPPKSVKLELDVNVGQ